ncbi:2-polyprenyl-6-methoxyphenol hydroxylase-like FAD-dependent oxidoreductase [Devosia sp. UYZn731]|uniref:FAD-dependent monooxygenase n=1 Tax=Devosia sp. UYZn731 TaxID=3156345 RepID=UPI00339B78D8
MSPIPFVATSENIAPWRIAICGAGIGGLVLAIQLRQAGLDPVVFERRNEAQLRSEGVFLTLAPNGVNALRALGLADAVVEAGLLTRGIAMFNERGKKLGLIDYRTHKARFGAPSVTIGRGVLLGLLLDAARQAGADLRLEQDIDGIAEGSDGVGLRSGGALMSFDMAIGCDGLRSSVRRLIFPELPQPVYSGLIGTGGMVEAPGVASTDGIMNMTFGKRAFFGYLRLPGAPVMWFNTYPALEGAVGAVASPAAYARQIAAMHRDDPLDNAAIMSGVTAIDRQYAVYDMPELPRWHSGRVLLMGDAAHAVAPHSGQGASMAIEDGLVLAACLAAPGKIAAAFERFVGLRKQRVQTAIRIGRAAGSQKHAQSWLQLRIRDLLLPLFIPMGVKAQERMFGFRADLNPLAQPAQ